jgi:hypothetical protein
VLSAQRVRDYQDLSTEYHHVSSYALHLSEHTGFAEFPYLLLNQRAIDGTATSVREFGGGGAMGKVENVLFHG